MAALRAPDAALFRGHALLALRGVPRFWEEVVRRPSACVPAGTVVATIVNRHHVDLLNAQTAPLAPCFLDRYGALCLGAAAANVSCIPWADAAASEFGGGEYTMLTWLKWEVLGLAMRAPSVEATLWIDCDIAILRNPFSSLPPHGADLSHQRNAVAGGLNTGLMLVRSKPLVRHVLEHANWWEPQRDLEQVVVERLLGAGGYSLAPLEYKTFASHCWLKTWPNATKYALALLCHASTLHTNCLAKAADKLAAVDAVKSLHRARCRPATWHRLGGGGGGGGRARLKGGVGS